MSHISIAIIRKKNLENQEHEEYSYLVQALGSNSHQFLNVVESAIGGGFDFSRLKRYVLKYLDLRNTNLSIDKKSYYDLTEFLSVNVLGTIGVHHMLHHALLHCPMLKLNP